MPYAKITHHDKNVSTQNDNSHLGFVFQAKLHKDLFFEDDYNLINNKDFENEFAIKASKPF